MSDLEEQVYKDMVSVGFDNGLKGDGSENKSMPKTEVARRYGKFRIANDTVNSQQSMDEMVKILALMSFVPFRVECMYYPPEFKYEGYSTLFREVKEGEMMPEYTIIIDNKYDEETKTSSIVKVTAEEIKREPIKLKI